MIELENEGDFYLQEIFESMTTLWRIREIFTWEVVHTPTYLHNILSPIHFIQLYSFVYTSCINSLTTSDSMPQHITQPESDTLSTVKLDLYSTDILPLNFKLSHSLSFGRLTGFCTLRVELWRSISDLSLCSQIYPKGGT